MAVAEAFTPTILLLGGGYTLQRVAAKLPVHDFVITSRFEDTCAAWRAHGWRAHRVSLQEPETIRAVVAMYPSLRVLVDSVPPVRGSDPAQGVQAVCDATRNSSLTRVLYLSTTGVFGVRDGSIVSEQTPAAPWNEQGEARLVCEQAYRACGVRSTSLRLPAIYGPDRGLHVSLRHGTYKMVGSGESWSNRIHVEDLSEIIIRACRAAELPEVLCVSDDCPARAREVVDFLCAREGLPFPSSVSEDEVLAAKAYTMLSNQRVSNALMKRVLSYELRFPSYRKGFVA